MRRSLAPLFAALLIAAPSLASDKLKVLSVDGQNNHRWEETTPLIVDTLESTGRFDVTVETTPPSGEDMSSFSPDFADYDVVVSNYNGDSWSAATKKAFEQYVQSGGGFVSVHAADNSFPDWPQYNQMIGLGGWGGRNEKDGPYVRWQEGKIVQDASAGRGGSHGARHPFEIVVRDPDHPITAAIPRSFLQAEDELYAELRGPAENLHILATAYSDPSTRGTGKHEPVLMAIEYGKGRVFHTTLGHDAKAMQGVAFQVTLQRGTEWAATGEVTLPPVSDQVLTRTAVATRNPAAAADDSDQVSASQMPDIDQGDWKPIFNGENLKNWVQRNGTATYRVEDGVVVGKTSVGSPNSFMTTKKDYGNFELTFEVNVDPGLNSGVQIRSRSTPDYKDGRVHGPQVEIETAPGESGYIYSEGTGRGWISDAQPIKDAYQNGEWNRYVIRAVGPRLQTWINGRPIEDLVDDESPQSGFIGLQVHGIPRDKGPFEVRWRDIRVRELPDDAVAQ